MSNTLEERDAMIDMAMGAGYHITHIVHIIDFMVDFDKATKGMPREKKLKLLEEDRWLGNENFKRYDAHLCWLDILDMDKDEWNKIMDQVREMRIASKQRENPDKDKNGNNGAVSASKVGGNDLTAGETAP